MNAPTRAASLLLLAFGSLALALALVTAARAAGSDVAGVVTAIVCLAGAGAGAWYAAWSFVALAALALRWERGRIERVLRTGAPRLVRRTLLGAAGASIALAVGAGDLGAPAMAAGLPDDLGYGAGQDVTPAPAAPETPTPPPATTEPTAPAQTTPSASATAPTASSSPSSTASPATAPPTTAPPVVIPRGAGEKRLPSPPADGTPSPASPVHDLVGTTDTETAGDAEHTRQVAAEPGALVAEATDTGATDTGATDAGATDAGATAATTTYTVRPGDTLWDIARRHGSATNAEIAEAWPRWWELNRERIGDDPDLIHPGLVLETPTTGASS